MSKDAVESLRVNLDDLSGVLVTLSDDEWQAPSDCAGWRVQDVVAHLNASAKLITGNQQPPADDEPLGAEDLAERLIAEQKDWGWQKVYEEFNTYTDDFVAALGTMQDEPIASIETPMSDLGTHPTHLLANAFAFDTYCHLRHDILGPATSIDRELPDGDDLRLRPGIDWMFAGLPQMCTAELTPVVTAKIRLELTGPGGGTWVLGPAGEDGLVVVTEGDGEAAAVVRSSAHDFYSWATTRSDWRDSCEVSGDTELATTVLDAINVI